MPKGYIIGHITVTNPEAYKEYVAKDTPVLKRLGAKFLVRGGKAEVMEGEAHQRHIVFEFPSFDAAMAAYKDPEYSEISLIRKANAESTIIIVEGHDDV